MKALGPLIESKFKEATGGSVELDIKYFATNHLPAEGEIVSDKKHDYFEIKDKYPWLSEDSAKRIWYYENGIPILEILEAIKSLNKEEVLLTDIIIVLTETQFEGIAMEVGRMLLLEYPVEGAWAQENIYNVEEPTKYFIADEIIHEAGHYMGLRHACEKQFEEWRKVGFSRENNKCDECQWKDDVMSYCRNRDGEHTYKFTECTREFINDLFIPLFLDGGKVTLQERGVCD